MMPGMNHENTKANLEDIYDEYAQAVTVPLTIDWGNKAPWRESGYNKEKQLPAPPSITDSFEGIPGRRRFGSSRSPSPLAREWSASDSASSSEDIPNTTSKLVRRSAMRRRTRDSCESVESLWFGPVGFDVSSPPAPPLKSTSSSPKKRRDSSGFESEDSGSCNCSSRLVLEGSVDIKASTRSRIRILNHENTARSITPTEICVGAIYEVVSYVWDTMSHPYNINSFKSIFRKYALPRSNVVSLVTSSSMSFDKFFKTTELQVNVNPSHKPRYTSLESLEITLPQDLISALSTIRDQTQIKAMIRLTMIQQIGEYIYNHVLLHDGIEMLISPSIDLARGKERKRGEEICIRGILGGIPSYRSRCGRIQVLFRKEGLVYRVPEKLMREMYESTIVRRFKVDQLFL